MQDPTSLSDVFVNTFFLVMYKRREDERDEVKKS